MRETLVKHSVGYYRREMVANPKNLNDRDNPQERLELSYFRKVTNKKIYKV